MIRKGKEGGFESVTTKEVIEEFDRKIQEMLTGTGRSF